MSKTCINCWNCVNYNGNYVCDIKDKEVHKNDSCKNFNSGGLMCQEVEDGEEN